MGLGSEKSKKLGKGEFSGQISERISVPPSLCGVLRYKIYLRVVTNQGKVVGQENNSHTCWSRAKV